MTLLTNIYSICKYNNLDICFQCFRYQRCSYYNCCEDALLTLGKFEVMFTPILCLIYLQPEKLLIFTQKNLRYYGCIVTTHFLSTFY